MLKAKDGAKVIQLVPVPMHEKTIKKGEHKDVWDYESGLVCWFRRHDPDDSWDVGDIWYLAVMDDGSIRPLGMSADSYYSKNGALEFLDDTPSADNARIESRWGW